MPRVGSKSVSPVRPSEAGSHQLLSNAREVGGGEAQEPGEVNRPSGYLNFVGEGQRAPIPASRVMTAYLRVVGWDPHESFMEASNAFHRFN